MLTFDFETTNLRKGSALEPDNRIVMVAWQHDDGEGWCHSRVQTHVGDILDARAFWRALEQHDELCCYNVKFGQHWLKRLGFDIDSKTWHDPMLAEKVLLGNVKKPMDLGSVCARYGFDVKDPVIDGLMKGGVCPTEMPQRRLLARCVRDVRTTRSLHYALRSKLFGL